MTTSFPIGNTGGSYGSLDFVQALESADLKALITNVGSGVGAAPAGGAAPAAGGAAPAAAAEVSLTLNHYGGLHGGIQLKTQSDFMGIFL